MPCFVGCLALAMPRVMLVAVYFFSTLLEDNFSTLWLPFAGLIFAPLTTMAYAYAHQRCGGPPTGIWIALIVVAVLLDLGLLRSGRGKKKEKPS